MADPVHVPGYEVGELIGYGGAGEVWRARDLATGEVVALKRLHVRGASAAQRLRREAAILAAVAGPHVIGVRAVVVDGDDALLVLDHAGGGSLATVLAVRGRIEAPEVVTVLAPLAAALAAAHDRGLVHGDITPANILFTVDGRPMLADFGVAHAIGLGSDVVEGTVGYVGPEVAAGAAVSTASDVYALGAIGYAALVGHPPSEPEQEPGPGNEPGDELATAAPSAPPALVSAIEAALAVDPFARPDARALAAAILDACAAGPVDQDDGGSPPQAPVTGVVRPARGATPVPPTRPEPASVGGRRHRRLLVVAGTIAAISLAIGLGEVWGRQGHGAAAALPAVPRPSVVTTESPSPTASPSAASSAGWLTVVKGLAAARVQAFTEADPSMLTSVYASGSPAYDSDRATVRSLADRGLRARGFAITVTSVRVEHADAATARLHVVDRLAGYTLVDASGVVQGSGAGRGSRSFTMVVRRTGSGWRITQVTSA
jgi:hypothetical protein